MRSPLMALLAAAALALSLSACDSEKIVELTPGEATESDVRQKMGQPDDVWEDDNGSRVLEFTRQPEGTRNWQARIGPDGKLIAFKQVLTVANMDKVQAGMSELEVRRLIGKPGRVKSYELQKQTSWEYRYADGASQPGAFTITFDANKKVLSTAKGPDAKDAKGQ
jgi:SmpA / OmlA family